MVHNILSIEISWNIQSRYHRISEESHISISNICIINDSDIGISRGVKQSQ